MDRSRVLINLQNGTLDVIDGVPTLREFRQSDCLKYVLPYQYDPDAKCPRCSRICRDYKPPDFHPAGDWDFPDVDGMELAMSWGSFSLYEHASEG